MSEPPPGSVLSRSLAADQPVGSNQRGRMAGAGWLYALPRLAFRAIVVVGHASPATLAGLAAAGTRVDVFESSGGRRRRIQELAERSGWDHVRAIDPMADRSDQAATIDLLVISEGRHGSRTWAMAPRLLRRLAADGIVVLPPAVLDVPEIAAAIGERHRLTLALTPSGGEVRSAAPATDLAMRALIRRFGLEGERTLHPRLARLSRGLARLPGLPRAPRRKIVAVGASVDANSVPTYLQQAADASGRDLNGWGWGVAARGDYDSQKVLVFLTPPGATEPTGLVKVTRSSTHAGRLENEGAALHRLASLPVATERTPTVWFSGRHGGRALLGESVVTGADFRSVARWRSDCPNLADALDWLTDLAVATRRPVPAAAVEAALVALLERYEAVYRPDRDESQRLRAIIAGIGAQGAPIPSVFQHGDPGIWNLLVAPGGRTVFLDWEAAEPDGLPLWDILYFFRSYAVATSRRLGVRDRLLAASHHLLDASPLSGQLTAAVDRYRERTELPVAAVHGLILGCWIHRSLKEATRLPEERVADGQFVRLIRRTLSAPEAPTLLRLTGRMPRTG